ncbi:MAG: WhiB family transcriptional regulator [Microthrixaceae bacterium]
MRQAACRGMPTPLFFPGRGLKVTGALEVCAACPVRAECSVFALEHDEQGVWGAAGRRQRARLLRLMRGDA